MCLRHVAPIRLTLPKGPCVGCAVCLVAVDWSCYGDLLSAFARLFPSRRFLLPLLGHQIMNGRHCVVCPARGLCRQNSFCASSVPVDFVCSLEPQRFFPVRGVLRMHHNVIAPHEGCEVCGLLYQGLGPDTAFAMHELCQQVQAQLASAPNSEPPTHNPLILTM